MTEPDPAPRARTSGAAIDGDKADQSLGRAAFAGVFWSTLHSWGGRLISTVVFVVIGRIVSPREFGLVSLAALFVEFGSLIAVSGFNRALVQREEVEAEHLDAAFWSSTAIGGALCAALLVSAGWIADLLGDPDFAPVLRALSVTFVLAGVGAVSTSILQRRLEFKAFAVRQLAAIGVGGVLGVTLAIAGAGVWALVAQSLGYAFVSAVVTIVYARWLPRARFSRRHWRDLTRFGIASLGIDLLGISVRRFDDLLIGVVLGPTALGYYSVAFRTFSIAVELVSHSLTAVFFPILARLAPDRERAGRVLVAVTRVSGCVVVPVFFGLTILADHAVLGLFGEQWQPAVLPLRYLALSVAVATTFGLLLSREVLLAAGRAKLELQRTVLVSFFFLLGDVIGVRWGINGVAASRLAMLVFIPLDLYLMRVAFPFDMREFLKACAKPLPATIAMVAALLAADVALDPPAGSTLWLVALSVAGGVVYVGFLILTARSTAAELVTRIRNRGEA